MVNYGSIDIPTPWTFSIMNPDYLEVFQTWNWESSGIDSAGKATGYANQVPCSASACAASFFTALSVARSPASCHTQLISAPTQCEDSSQVKALLQQGSVVVVGCVHSFAGTVCACWP